MACFHHHNQHSPTCFCSNRCNTPPPPPPAIDPILLQSIVSQLLQNPQTAHLYSAATTPFDLHPCSSQYPQHRNQKLPKQKQSYLHRQLEDQFQDQYSVLTSLLQRIDGLESSLHRFSSSATTSSLRHVAARTIQFHFRAHLVRRSRALRELKELASIKSALSVLKSSLSLQKRIDLFSLSHEALHLISRLETIESCDQMVRDSKSSIRREIGRFLELIDEICAKRNIVSLKMVKQIRMGRYPGRDSSGAYHRGKSSKQHNVDSDEKRLIKNLRERVKRIQHSSKDLIDEEDSADSDDSNGGDDVGAYHRGKSSKQHNVHNDEKRLTDNLRERVEKIQHMSKDLIDEEDSVDSVDSNGSGAYHRGKSSKQHNMDSDEKRLINNLRERVERIQYISKGLKDEKDSADFNGGNGAIDRKTYTDRCRRREVIGKHRSPAEKHVWFAEDGGVPMKRVSCNAERREESVDVQHEEDGEMESDTEENDAESAEGSEFEDKEQNGSLEGSSQGSDSEETRIKSCTHENDMKVKPSHRCQDEKLILSALPPVKMEGRADSVKKQNGVKIIG